VSFFITIADVVPYVPDYECSMYRGVPVVGFVQPTASGTAVLLDPPFLVDYYKVIELLQYFTNDMFKHKYTPRLAINGLVKTGETTVLFDVLPAVVRRQLPNALFWILELKKVSCAYSYSALTHSIDMVH
jgi:hypothetical protein